MKVEKLAGKIAQLRSKLTKAEVEVRLLQSELERTEERYKLAVAGSRVESRKA